MKASELEAGRLYRQTRISQGMPNSFFEVLDSVAVRRLGRRLAARRGGLSGTEARLLAAVERGDVIVEATHRHTFDGQRREFKTRFGLRPAEDVRLRTVRNKPGYAARGAA